MAYPACDTSGGPLLTSLYGHPSPTTWTVPGDRLHSLPLPSPRTAQNYGVTAYLGARVAPPLTLLGRDGLGPPAQSAPPLFDLNSPPGARIHVREGDTWLGAGAACEGPLRDAEEP